VERGVIHHRTGNRFQGQVGEQATMFFLIPGTALEFKSFKDLPGVCPLGFAGNRDQRSASAAFDLGCVGSATHACPFIQLPLTGWDCRNSGL
jgi:hypothetical protein